MFKKKTRKDKKRKKGILSISTRERTIQEDLMDFQDDTCVPTSRYAPIIPRQSQDDINLQPRPPRRNYHCTKDPNSKPQKREYKKKSLFNLFGGSNISIDIGGNERMKRIVEQRKKMAYYRVPGNERKPKCNTPPRPRVGPKRNVKEQRYQKAQTGSNYKKRIDFDNGSYEGEVTESQNSSFKIGILLDGFGTYKYNNGGMYIGCFSLNMKHGKGCFCFPNGSKYDGDWKDDIINGKGTMTFKNGNKYVGDFRDGIYEGKGKLYYNNGKIQYDGTFSGNKKHGF